MGKAARAIIIENGKILVMHRNKEGSAYYTLVGGRLNGGESPEQALRREVMEETGLEVVKARLVYEEIHPAPYNDQYIFLCEVAPHGIAAIQDASEEGFMNRLGLNTHQPLWSDVKTFERLPFRTPQLMSAIVHGLRHGFPEHSIKL